MVSKEQLFILIQEVSYCNINTTVLLNKKARQNLWLLLPTSAEQILMDHYPQKSKVTEIDYAE
jgi:hypothetical protein